jgi:hypothetical protein
VNPIVEKLGLVVRKIRIAKSAYISAFRSTVATAFMNLIL